MVNKEKTKYVLLYNNYNGQNLAVNEMFFEIANPQTKLISNQQ